MDWVAIYIIIPVLLEWFSLVYRPSGLIIPVDYFVLGQIYNMPE